MSKSEMQITDCTSEFVIFETQHIFNAHASLNTERGITPHGQEGNLITTPNTEQPAGLFTPLSYA